MKKRERHYLNYSAPDCPPKQRGEIYAKAEKVLDAVYVKITTKYRGRRQHYKAMREVRQKPDKYGNKWGVLDHAAESIRFWSTTFQISHPYAPFEREDCQAIT